MKLVQLSMLWASFSTTPSHTWTSRRTNFTYRSKTACRSSGRLLTVWNCRVMNRIMQLHQNGRITNIIRAYDRVVVKGGEWYSSIGSSSVVTVHHIIRSDISVPSVTLERQCYAISLVLISSKNVDENFWSNSISIATWPGLAMGHTLAMIDP